MTAVSLDRGRPASDRGLVSIVLPTYNGSRYIEETISSCLRQTYKRLELIIVDDGSTDDTSQIISEYARRDARIRCLRHTWNQRLPAALNTGFARAAGQFLTWISDDNRFVSTALEEMVEFLFSRSDVDLVYTDYSIVDESRKTLKVRTVQPPYSRLGGGYLGPCFLYRRRVKELVGGYSDAMYLAEDLDFFLRVSKYCGMAPLHRDLFRYRVRAGSLSNLHEQRVAVVVDKALAAHIIDLPWASASMKTGALLNLGVRAARRGAWRWGMIQARRAWALSPRESVRTLVWGGLKRLRRAVLRGAHSR